MTSLRLPLWLLSTSTLLLLFTTYLAVLQSPDTLSPQGCRMSWMSPSYILHDQFNSNWTRHARRYSLWLYREAGWESPDELKGIPVLFIPGNAGSSRQVRSIASSATRQYYSSPYEINSDMASTHLKPLDFFAVDFNEDFSALHGPTLLSQREYTSAAVGYILSLYPPNTQIIVMGHSMGGIVAMSLLPSSDIFAIITMSTPHSLPPARLDARIEAIYKASWNALRNDSTPVLSICGGATDLLIPSETCSIDLRDTNSTVGWRKSIFTTCMEGTWTGVGHREMVWCHQVRWRVARAALELGKAKTSAEKGAVFDRWFRDIVQEGFISSTTFLPVPAIHLADGHNLFLRETEAHTKMYLLPVATSEEQQFTLYVSQGKVGSLSPYHASYMEVSVWHCIGSEDNCQPVQPRMLHLIPNPAWDKRFPVNEEGVDESDGVVHFEAGVRSLSHDRPEWIAVKVSGGGDRRSWIVGGLASSQNVTIDESLFAPIRGNVNIRLDPATLSANIRLSNFLSSSLLVYRVEPVSMAGSCKNALLPPLLLHKSGSAESHFHSFSNRRSILLHTHSSGPFVYSKPSFMRGVELEIFSSGECGVADLRITVDWWSSLSTWGLRYWTTSCAWALGVVGVILLRAWINWETGDSFPTLSESLGEYVSKWMLPLAGVLLVLSCLPLGPEWLLGNSGEFILAPMAPLLLFVSSGCVAVSTLLLRILMSIISGLINTFGRITAVFTRKETKTPPRNLWSFILILVLVALIIPSQVAFLVCFVVHLATCTTQIGSSGTPQTQSEAHAQKMTILLLIFWLLPLVAPVLAVWVRTLATAGLTTPFDGDHDVLASASFLLFVDFASNTTVPPFERARSKTHEYLTYAVLSGLPLTAFLFGGRYTFRIYTMSNFIIGYLCLTRIGRRLWRY